MQLVPSTSFECDSVISLREGTEVSSTTTLHHTPTFNSPPLFLLRCIKFYLGFSPELPRLLYFYSLLAKITSLTTTFKGTAKVKSVILLTITF